MIHEPHPKKDSDTTRAADTNESRVPSRPRIRAFPPTIREQLSLIERIKRHMKGTIENEL